MAGSFPLLFSEAWKEDIHVFTAEGDTKLPFETNTQRLGPADRVLVSDLRMDIQRNRGSAASDSKKDLIVAGGLTEKRKKSSEEEKE
jgi:hypothetical protein